MIVACHRHGVEEHGLHLCGGASPEQAHGVLHHRCVAGQRDSATVNACEAELLLGHPEELAEDHRAEEHKRHLDLTPSVVYTTKWPLPATDEDDVPHDPPVSSAVDDDQASLFRPIDDTICHFLAS
ncbi:hypothetical protein ACQJBY_045276 [Aegilops geniculata]